jgi:hypothetical protein
MKIKLRKLNMIAYLLLIVFTAAACGANPAAAASTGGARETALAQGSSPAAEPALISQEPAPAVSKTPAESPEVSQSPSPSTKKSASPSPEQSAKLEKKGPTEAEKKAFIEKTKAKKSGDKVDVSGMDRATLNKCFFYVSISDDVFARMEGKSFKKDCTTKRSELRYVKVLYYGFDKKTHVGELVVNKAIAKDVVGIFQDLYKAKYRIEKMKLIDDYDADDNKSMADNNTSSFNFRHVEGSKALSQHAYGRAIDINPKYNPYIVTIKGKRKVEPPNGKKYADRSIDLPYIIHKNDVCYKAFVKRGFDWGGSWRPDPDYQHFAKKKK